MFNAYLKCFQKNGKLVKNDFIDLEYFNEEILLTEDIFQAYFENYTIDCGWYGNWYGDTEGRFITYLIKKL